MPLYFAYGANMDVAAMETRCPASRPLGTARLMRHRIAIMREGYATVLRDPQALVHGVLWDLAVADVPALDKYEAVAQGLYAKITQGVVTGAGARRALVYVGANAGPGRPKPGYLEGILASAEAWNLPAGYRAQIARLGERGSGLPPPVASPVPDLPEQVAGVRPRALAPEGGIMGRRRQGVEP